MVLVYFLLCRFQLCFRPTSIDSAAFIYLPDSEYYFPKHSNFLIVNASYQLGTQFSASCVWENRIIESYCQTNFSHIFIYTTVSRCVIISTVFLFLLNISAINFRIGRLINYFAYFSPCVVLHHSGDWFLIHLVIHQVALLFMIPCEDYNLINSLDSPFLTNLFHLYFSCPAT